MQTGSSTADSPVLARSPSQGEVAELTCESIESMDRSEMLDAIRAARVPTLSGRAMVHVEFLDAEQLRRIVYFARECCRHQGY